MEASQGSTPHTGHWTLSSRRARAATELALLRDESLGQAPCRCSLMFVEGMNRSDFTAQTHLLLIGLDVFPKDKLMYFRGDYEIWDYRWFFLVFFPNIIVFCCIGFNTYRNICGVHVIKY